MSKVTQPGGGGLGPSTPSLRRAEVRKPEQSSRCLRCCCCHHATPNQHSPNPHHLPPPPSVSPKGNAPRLGDGPCDQASLTSPPPGSLPRLQPPWTPRGSSNLPAASQLSTSALAVPYAFPGMASSFSTFKSLLKSPLPGEARVGTWCLPTLLLFSQAASTVPPACHPPPYNKGPVWTGTSFSSVGDPQLLGLCLAIDMC